MEVSNMYFFNEAIIVDSNLVEKLRKIYGNLYTTKLFFLENGGKYWNDVEDINDYTGNVGRRKLKKLEIKFYKDNNLVEDINIKIEKSLSMDFSKPTIWTVRYYLLASSEDELNAMQGRVNGILSENIPNNKWLYKIPPMIVALLCLPAYAIFIYPFVYKLYIFFIEKFPKIYNSNTEVVNISLQITIYGLLVSGILWVLFLMQKYFSSVHFMINEEKDVNYNKRSEKRSAFYWGIIVAIPMGWFLKILFG